MIPFYYLFCGVGMDQVKQYPLFGRISEYVFYHGEQSPQHEALVFQDQRITYKDFADRVKAISQALIGSGVQPGDRIAFLGSPRPESLLVMMACVDIGAIWMGMHPRYQLAEFCHVTELAEPRVVFAFAEIDGRIYASELEHLKAKFSCIEHVVLLDGMQDSYGESFDEFLELGQNVQDEDWQKARDGVVTDDSAVIIFTSGTTGKPKGAMNSHFGLVHCAHIELSRWPDPDMRVLQNMPINHIANIGMMSCCALVAGGTLVYQDRFDAGDLLQLIEKERITFWLQSPIQFHLVSQHEEFDNTDLSSVRYMIWGGGPMPQHLVEKLHKKDAILATAYGMTELTAYASYSDLDADAETLSDSIGRPEPRYNLRLMRMDGSVAEVGESGEIQARGRWLMNGYFNQPVATREAYTKDGWFKTGDVAELRADGNWRLVGRLKEMYKSGGFNIYPREIEIALELHPEVALTAVLGVSDDLYDEVGYAFVEPVAGSAVTIEELDQWCRQQLANYKIPKTFELLNELPRLPIGKIDKQLLRKRLSS